MGVLAGGCIVQVVRSAVGGHRRSAPLDPPCHLAYRPHQVVDLSFGEERTAAALAQRLPLRCVMVRVVVGDHRAAMHERVHDRQSGVTGNDRGMHLGVEVGSLGRTVASAEEVHIDSQLVRQGLQTGPR